MLPPSARGSAGVSPPRDDARGAARDPWLAALCALLREGVLVLDGARVPVAGNAAARDLLGLPRDAELAEVWRVLEPHLAPLLESAENEPASFPVEIEAGGRTRRLALRTVRAGVPAAGSLVVIEDRTRQEAMETSLRLASRMRAQRNLYRSQAHDLRAPLNALTLNVELLRQSVDEESDAGEGVRRQRAELVGVLVSEIERLDRSLQRLLAQARHAEGGAAERFDVVALLHEVAALVKPACERQRIHLALEVPRGPAPVLGRRDEIEQALLNVVLNAIEAMPDGGRLVIGAAIGAASIMVRVRDDGPGVPADVRDHVFDMHVTTKQSGTGIGLSVTRSLVQAHGGRVAIESREGEGTTVEIDLPTAPEDS